MTKKVIYWCSRAIRLHENPALEVAYHTALNNKCTLEVHFFALKEFPYANARNMHFLLSGLLELSAKLKELNIPLIVSQDLPLDFFNKHRESIHSIITEQASLRYVRLLHESVKTFSKENNISFQRVNTASVVPIEIASNKLEYAARTFRPKILSKYKDFIQESEPISKMNQSYDLFFDEKAFDELYNVYAHLDPQPVDWLKAGEDAALKQLALFIKDGLNRYHLRNEITADATSKLSAYLHFGMLSPRKMVRCVLASHSKNTDLFIEEAMVRRELAENYCYFEENYDNLKGAWNWAKKTLEKHEEDAREFQYTIDELKNSKTHDSLWNRCQDDVREKGYLHGYLRMYWAKQVLLWSENAQQAIEKLIFLNDTYFLDGRDANGYTGIMWSIAGVHDRPWFDKDIIGLIRPMSAKGTLKKSKLKLPENL